jgi:hypothetical protein
VTAQIPAWHRDEPPPPRPCAQRQAWEHLLFAHWPLPPSALRAQVPEPLELEAFGGAAWIAAVPFRITGMRLRWLPPLPGLTAMDELNLRTYVRHAGQRGVYFFSLDATSRLAVAAARAWYRLPYLRARIEVGVDGGRVVYRHWRTHHGAPPAEFTASYAASGPIQLAARGSLEHFLTERYRLFTRDRRGRLWKAEIHHGPWPLQRVTAEIDARSLAAAVGVELPATAPHLLFARRLEVQIWGPETVASPVPESGRGGAREAGS